MTIRDKNATPNAESDLVEAVRILHSIATPAAEIARRLHIDQASVRYVIEHGRFPSWELPLLWRDDADATPGPDDPEPKKAPTVRHFLWWMVAAVGMGVAL